MSNFTIEAIKGNLIITLDNENHEKEEIVNFKIKLNTQKEFKKYQIGEKIYLIEGQTVQFVNKFNTFVPKTHPPLTFSVKGDGRIKVYGQLRSLASKSGTVSPSFNSLFKNCMALANAEELIFDYKTITSRGYQSMFENCRNLLRGPKTLNAEVVKEYGCKDMFKGCVKLTTAPELPALDLAPGAYHSMFWNCFNMKHPPALPATTLAKGCYSWMFYYCIKFKDLSDFQLPALVAANCCYKNMFTDCKRLKKGPKTLPATTLAPKCYKRMFEGCKELEEAPYLLAEKLEYGSYDFIFSKCPKINKINTNFKEWPSVTTAEETEGKESGIINWLDSVNTTKGLFRKAPELEIKRGNNYIPENWTII